MSKNMEEICLKHDNGEVMRFQGRLFSECSYFDDENNCLTRQQLYVAENGEQVYYIVKSCGQKRERHAYRLSVDGDTCLINNGSTEISLQFDLLMLAVRTLCGLNADATPSLAAVEEILRAANS